MKTFKYNQDKNDKLLSERGVRFEDVIRHLALGNLLDDLEHPNQEKYPNQFVFIIAMNDYVYLVPYVENDEEIFLKTVIPSRKLTKQYLGVIMSELDPEELTLLAGVENGEWVSRPSLQTRKSALQEAATQQCAEKNHIDITLSTLDFERLKALAANRGLNYQALAESILHRYLEHI